MSDEVLYQGPSGSVTRTMARLNDRTIPVRQIGSVSSGAKKAGSTVGGIFALAGLGAGIAGVLLGAFEDGSRIESGWQPVVFPLGLAILGAVLFVFGAVFVASGGAKHAVTIEAGGSRITVRAKDDADAMRIRAALEQAIAGEQ